MVSTLALRTATNTCAVRCESWAGCSSGAEAAENLVAAVKESEIAVSVAMEAVLHVGGRVKAMAEVDLAAVGSATAGLAAVELGDALLAVERVVGTLLEAACWVEAARAAARVEGLMAAVWEEATPSEVRAVEGRVVADLGGARLSQQHHAVVLTVTAVEAVSKAAGALASAAMAADGEEAARAAVMAAQLMVTVATAKVAMQKLGHVAERATAMVAVVKSVEAKSRLAPRERVRVCVCSDRRPKARGVNSLKAPRYARGS